MCICIYVYMCKRYFISCKVATIKETNTNCRKMLVKGIKILFEKTEKKNNYIVVKCIQNLAENEK